MERFGEIKSMRCKMKVTQRIKTVEGWFGSGWFYLRKT